MPTMPFALRSQPRFASENRPQQNEAAGFVPPDEAQIEIPTETDWLEESPLDGFDGPHALPESASSHLAGERASCRAIARDVLRELAGILREAYSTLCRDGCAEALRMLTSHLAQLFVSTSAFFIFNLGRRLDALWQRMRGVS